MRIKMDDCEEKKIVNLCALSGTTNPLLRFLFGIGVIVLLAFADPRLHAASGSEPSNTNELASKKIKNNYDFSADAKRKAAMSAAELAWETLLEQNLGSFYLPLYKQDKLNGKETAWDYVEDDPKLPRVLLIGDSISRGYTLDVRHALAGKANVHRAPANCGSTAMGLEYLPIWIGTGHWDIIHFNFGIWDRATHLDVYAANLEKMVEQLQKTGAKLIWARTTPPLNVDNAEKYSTEVCSNLNQVADVIMQKHGIPEDDLYGVVVSRLTELQLKGNVHFKPDGYEVLGHEVAGSIMAQLGNLQTVGAASNSGMSVAVEKDPRVQAEGNQWRFEKATITDPNRPRLLLIGDSILNGYLPLVRSNLDGKVYVDAWVNPYYQSAQYNQLLAQVLTNGPYAVVHINVGLHGWQTGRIKEGAFEPLTKAFVEVIREKCPNAKIIWANTTPITEKGEVGKLDHNLNPIIVEDNQMAEKVMEEMNVPVNDFYTLLANKLYLAKGDQFHWTEPAYKILADAAIRAIVSALPEN